MLRRLYLGSCALLLSTTCFATPHYGAALAYAAYSHEPPSLRGYQALITYDPDRFHWREFNILFDAGFAYLSVNNPHNSALNIYTIAPIIRYRFKQRGPIRPYLDISIGLAYLNHTRIECRNLGMHVGFQDRMGAGVLFGPSEQFSAGVHMVHYSNAGLAAHNSGITIPLVFDIGYRFD